MYVHIHHEASLAAVIEELSVKWKHGFAALQLFSHLAGKKQIVLWNQHRCHSWQLWWMQQPDQGRLEGAAAAGEIVHVLDDNWFREL